VASVLDGGLRYKSVIAKGTRSPAALVGACAHRRAGPLSSAAEASRPAPSIQIDATTLLTDRGRTSQ
jgi:hypothetical protein